MSRLPEGTKIKLNEAGLAPMKGYDVDPEAVFTIGDLEEGTLAHFMGMYQTVEEIPVPDYEGGGTVRVLLFREEFEVVD